MTFMVANWAIHYLFVEGCVYINLLMATMVTVSTCNSNGYKWGGGGGAAGGVDIDDIHTVNINLKYAGTIEGRIA